MCNFLGVKVTKNKLKHFLMNILVLKSSLVFSLAPQTQNMPLFSEWLIYILYTCTLTIDDKRCFFPRTKIAIQTSIDEVICHVNYIISIKNLLSRFFFVIIAFNRISATHHATCAYYVIWKLAIFALLQLFIIRKITRIAKISNIGFFVVKIKVPVFSKYINIKICWSVFLVEIFQKMAFLKNWIF